MGILKVGSLLKIPYGQDKFALCQIVWISKMIKNCIGFIVRSTSFKDGDSFVLDRVLEIELPIGKIITIFASVENVKSNEWKVVGFSNVYDIDNFITHNIGGDLFIGDKYIRHLNNDEYCKYRKVLNSGNKAVDLILQKFDEVNRNSS